MLDLTPFDAALSASQAIGLALRLHPNKVVLSCSFGGPTGMVALDMVMKIDRSVPVYYLDTDLLFPETYELVERVSERYGIQPIPVRSTLGIQEQNHQFGDALWSRNPDLCCEIRKVRPQLDFLRDYDVWITGLRRDQGSTRAQTPLASWDDRFGAIRLCPFVTWSQERILAYVREHDVPYNPLNDRGYPSVGCVPCTRAIKPGEDPRAGRWSGLAKTECGLHKEAVI